MYKYVAKEQVVRYESYCRNVMGRLRKELEAGHSIRSYFTLIGSGAEDMVTRNGKGPFDLDYNIVLTALPEKYEDAPGQIKNIVRETLDGLVDERFSYGKGSTSSLTYLAHAEDRKRLVFSFDVAIIREREGKYKLVHDKGQNVFIWNQVPYSKKLDEKAAAVRKADCWDDVEGAYLELKNMYLRRQQEKSHPSFIVYAEAVNQVYQTIK